MRFQIPIKIIARLVSSFVILATAFVLLGTGYFYLFSYRHYHLINHYFGSDGSPSSSLSCYGPRGVLLAQSADDSVRSTLLDGGEICALAFGEMLTCGPAYPNPLGGSYDAIGLDQTWMTADDRYGPYGYGEDRGGYSRTHVDWDQVDWASLQNNCTARNTERFPAGTHLLSPSRLSLPSWKTRIGSKLPTSLRFKPPTGRTAIVLRTWGGHKFNAEDKLFLRSLIVETALSSGSQYAVYLLVDVHERAKKIFESDANYKTALEEIVPKEFQSIAVLFDGSLLDAWYPKVIEHR